MNSIGGKGTQADPYMFETNVALVESARVLRSDQHIALCFAVAAKKSFKFFVRLNLSLRPPADEKFLPTSRILVRGTAACEIFNTMKQIPGCENDTHISFENPDTNAAWYDQVCTFFLPLRVFSSQILIIFTI